MEICIIESVELWKMCMDFKKQLYIETHVMETHIMKENYTCISNFSTQIFIEFTFPMSFLKPSSVSIMKEYTLDGVRC